MKYVLSVGKSRINTNAWYTRTQRSLLEKDRHISLVPISAITPPLVPVNDPSDADARTHQVTFKKQQVAGIYPMRPIEFDPIGPNIFQNNAQTTKNPPQTIDTNAQLSNNQETEVQQVPNADTTAVTQVHSFEGFNVQACLTNSQSENTSILEVHLSDIVELPVIPPKVSKRNIRKIKSTILTSTPIKKQLEEKENRKGTKAEESKIKTK
ncbi:hypothetical protein HHI36_018417 [Cryptolaemus montrouzieri]|uniref:Uncharacterized protein n=1 Tax=Cryptolaemus montrouzieri TaxID=559131 RepID=A0ABD2P148_9CUCU